MRLNGRVKLVDASFPLRFSEAVALLHAATQAVKQYGELGVHKTLLDYFKAMNKKKIWLPVPIVEDLLYYAKLMDEEGKFQHPLGLTFKQFVGKLKMKNKFNHFQYEEKFGTIEENMS